MDEDNLDKELHIIEQVLGSEVEDLLSDGMGDEFDEEFINDLAMAAKRLMKRRGDEEEEEEEIDDYED